MKIHKTSYPLSTTIKPPSGANRFETQDQQIPNRLTEQIFAYSKLSFHELNSYDLIICHHLYMGYPSKF